MNRIVIDASVIAKYVLKEEHWEQVRDYLTAEPHSLDLALLKFQMLSGSIK
jgi:predicted nucleic acid-binding protein